MLAAIRARGFQRADDNEIVAFLAAFALVFAFTAVLLNIMGLDLVTS